MLARQLLLERAAVPIPEALERVAGIQAQYAPSTYIGLWTRVDGFDDRGALDRALADAAVVQGTLMRVTIHAVSAGDYWPFATAVRAARRALWLRARRDLVSEADMVAAARRLRRALAGGPLRRKQIEQLLGRPQTEGAGLWVDVLRVPPSSTWDHRAADLYALAEHHIPLQRPGAARALEHLVRSYLRGFGPASRKDVASWTGTRIGDVAPVLKRLGVVRYQGPDGAELVDLPGAALPDADTPAPPRLLPHWDATLLVHARRAGIVAEEHRARIFTSKNPHSVATFLVDGRVAGTWRLDGGRAVLEPFARLDRGARRALEDEARRLEAFAA